MNIKEAVSAQKFIDISEVKHGTIVLHGGGLRKILAVVGTNFEMKSEEEQEIILNTFQAFLNSLNFTLQIFIHSRKLNIDTYLQNLDARMNLETNELLRNQIAEYGQFIKSFVEQNAIMNKTYFVVVSFDSAQLPGGASISPKKLFGMFGKKTDANSAKAAEQSLEEKIEQLDQRVNQVIDGLSQIGLRSVALNDEELVELFFNLYNPETVEKGTLEIAKPENLTSTDNQPKTTHG